MKGRPLSLGAVIAARSTRSRGDRDAGGTAVCLQERRKRSSLPRAFVRHVSCFASSQPSHHRTRRDSPRPYGANGFPTKSTPKCPKC